MFTNHKRIYSFTSVLVNVLGYCCAFERKVMYEALKIGELRYTALLNESFAITFTYTFQKIKNLMMKCQELLPL